MLTPLTCLGKKCHGLCNNGLLFNRKMLHDDELYFCTSPFKRGDQHAPLLSDSDALHAAILFVLASAHQATLNELVDQATGGRYGTSKQFSDLFDAEFVLLIKQQKCCYQR